jgi:hypothetical protein
MFQFDEASLNSTDSSVHTTVSSVRTITITDGSNTSNATSLNGSSCSNVLVGKNPRQPQKKSPFLFFLGAELQS